MSSSYTQLLRQLYKINWYSPVKLGLENMHNLNRLLGDPLKGIPIVHVTGTNGKGSVAYKIARALTASGIRTGLFTSPHISSFKERIQVNYDLLTEEDVESILPRLFDLCKEHNIPATFFEITTALAFVKFKMANCEAIVLEVGIGGRLDSTNIVEPALSIVTTVQMDHMAILGDTLEKIAREKSGIIKPHTDALVGPGVPYAVARERAEEVKALLYTIPEVLRSIEDRQYDFAHQHSDDIEPTSIFSDTDVLNSDIAKADYIGEAMKVRPPCRYEEFEVHHRSTGQVYDLRVILDIAHNEAAIRALKHRTKLIFPQSNVKVLIGMSADKAISKCLPFIGELVQQASQNIYCTAAKHPRAIAAKDLRVMLNDVCSPASPNLRCEQNDGEVQESFRKAVEDSLSAAYGGDIRFDDLVFPPASSSSLHTAMEIAKNTLAATATAKNVIIVCGTAFIMSDVRTEIGLKEPNDGDILGTDNDTNKKSEDTPISTTKQDNCSTESQESSAKKPKLH